MRALIFGIALLVSGAINASEGPFEFVQVHEVEATSDQIFDSARMWIAETFQSGKDVTDLADKEMGVIIGNGRINLKHGFMTKTPAGFKMKIDVKDGRFRTTFSNVVMYFDARGKPVESANRKSLEPKLEEHFTELTSNLKAYIAAASAGSTDDW